MAASKTKSKSAKKAPAKGKAKHKGIAPAVAIPAVAAKPSAKASPRSGHVLGPTPTPFTAENQPTSEAKKKGWARRKALKELVEFTMKGKIAGSTKDYPHMTAQFYGIPVEEVSIRMIMEYRQIEKAILKADTGAFNAVMDRALGKSKQAIELIPDMTIKINGKVIKQSAQ